MFKEINKPLIMGILNVTPDSFSDGGHYTDIEAAVNQAEKMVEQGADIIDVGGESSRPGSEPVDGKTQIQRVVPVIKAIRQAVPEPIMISIDTTLASVASVALDAGAQIINDISAGKSDQKILQLASERNIPIILMHMLGSPKTMQENPRYTDVNAEVITALQKRVDEALKIGISRDNIILDPGIGFGKRKQDNISLLAHLDRLVKLGYPVLLGTSRKRFMGSICEVSEPAELVTATAVTSALGVMSGVRIFRVHDVKENKQAIDVAWAIKMAP